MKLLVFLALCFGCSSTKSMILSEKAKNLEVYPNKPLNCHVAGKVIGLDENGSTELATNDSLNQAAKLNATGIYVNQEVPNGKSRAVHATAYQCD